MARKKMLDEDEAVKAKGFGEEKERDEEVDLEDQEIESLIKGLPSGLRCISLYRIPSKENGGRPKFIAQLVPECFNESFIQDTYGGGTYFARWKKKDGKMLRTEQFDLDGPPKEQDAPKPKEQEPQEIERYQPEERSNHGGISAIELMTLINNARKESREEMMMIMNMMKPQQVAPPPDATQQVFNLVEKIVPLIGSGEGGGINPWLTALSQFKEPIMKIVETVNVAIARNVPNAPNAVPQSPTLPSTPQPHVKKEDDMIGLLLKQALPVLINGATRNADPAFYADMILDQVPENLYPKLFAWLQSPTCLESLIAIEPGIRFQSEWWGSLRNALIEAIQHATTSVQPDSESVESE